MPYGRFSTLWRRSFFTTSRWASTVLRRHRVEQVAHAIGFEEQRELERVRRHVDPVVGAVVLGRAVVVAAGALRATGRTRPA